MSEYPRYIKVRVLTPPNQAAKCVNSMKDALLGMTQHDRIMKQKIVKNDEFYWIVKLRDEKDARTMAKRAGRMETIIRSFYSTLFKLVGGVNRIANKSKKLARKAFKAAVLWKRKKWKYLSDKMGIRTGEFNDYVNKMTDDEFEDFLNITDKEMMQEFLKKELVQVYDVKYSEKDEKKR